MEDFVRWYSPRDWIACDHTSASHDHSYSGNSNTPSDPVDTTGDVTNNSTTDDITNNSNTTGWDEDWAEIDEQTSTNNTSHDHKVNVCSMGILLSRERMNSIL